MTTNLSHSAGNWVTGRVDGLEVQAKVFAEGSDEYGMPEDRRISKLWVQVPGGAVLYDFDRGDLGRNYLTDEGLALVIAAVTA
jgi:hypothetical protein